MSDTQNPAPLPAYDLRRLFKAIGGVGTGGPSAGAVERTDATATVNMLDEEPVALTGTPIDVQGFVDGIQANIHLTYRHGRPVVLTYAAAGAVARTAQGRIKGVALRESLNILASFADHEWLGELNTDIPVVALVGDTPPEMELGVAEHIGATRDSLERDIVSELVERGDGRAIVVDGSIMGRPVDQRVVGVTKSVATRYLADETRLFTLPQGWRSPRFSIRGVGAPRWSCYVQLADKNRGAWNLGLIRLETFDPDILDAVGMMALAERQGPRSGDARWDRHLAGVRAVEEFLRSKRPAVFS